MPGIIQEIADRNATRLGAAKELGRGLMRGDRADLRLGYDHANARIAALSAFALPEFDVVELDAHLVGYAMGLNDVPAAAAAALAADMLARKGSRASAALTDGFLGGQVYFATGAAYPSHFGLPGSDAPTAQAPGPQHVDITTAADGPYRRAGVADTLAGEPSPLAFATCGCGATKPGECTAAVEGFFTSLAERSDEELAALADGDACQAARWARTQRAVRTLLDRAAGMDDDDA